MKHKAHHIFQTTPCPTHESLRAYTRGSLDREVRHSLEAHLLHCAMCSDELEGLMLLGDESRLENLVSELDAAIAHRLAKPSHRIRFLNPRRFAIAAGIVLLVGLSTYFTLRLAQQVDQDMVAQESVSEKMIDHAPVHPESEVETTSEPILRHEPEGTVQGRDKHGLLVVTEDKKENATDDYASTGEEDMTLNEVNVKADDTLLSDIWEESEGDNDLPENYLAWEEAKSDEKYSYKAVNANTRHFRSKGKKRSAPAVVSDAVGGQSLVREAGNNDNKSVAESSDWLENGKLQLESGHIDSALVWFDRVVVRADVNLHEALYYKGIALIRHGRTDEGIQILREVASGKSNFALPARNYLESVPNR